MFDVFKIGVAWRGSVCQMQVCFGPSPGLPVLDCSSYDFLLLFFFVCRSGAFSSRVRTRAVTSGGRGEHHLQKHVENGCKRVGD